MNYQDVKSAQIHRRLLVRIKKATESLKGDNLAFFFERPVNDASKPLYESFGYTEDGNQSLYHWNRMDNTTKITTSAFNNPICKGKVVEDVEIFDYEEDLITSTKL